MNNCEYCSYVWVKIVIKGINNLTGVFSGVTRTIGDQKWSSNRNIIQYVKNLPLHFCIFVLLY
jgi:hypothetical protein